MLIVLPSRAIVSRALQPHYRGLQGVRPQGAHAVVSFRVIGPQHELGHLPDHRAAFCAEPFTVHDVAERTAVCPLTMAFI